METMSQWIYIGLFFIVGLIIPVGAIARGMDFRTEKTQSHQADNL